MPFDDPQEQDDETSTQPSRLRPMYPDSEQTALADDNQTGDFSAAPSLSGQQLPVSDAQFQRRFGAPPQAMSKPSIGQRILALGQQGASPDASAAEASTTPRTVGSNIISSARQATDSWQAPRLALRSGVSPASLDFNQERGGAFGSFVPVGASSAAGEGRNKLTPADSSIASSSDQQPGSQRGASSQGEVVDKPSQSVALPGLRDDLGQRRTLSRLVRGIRGSASIPQGVTPDGVPILDLTSQVHAPSRIPRQYDSGDYFSNVNDDVIVRNEGGSLLNGYVPRTKGGPDNSGVTVAAGFDIGQQSAADLRKLGLSQDIINQLSPYLDLKGQDARDALAKKPLTISANQAAEINQAAFQSYFDSAGQAFNKAKTDLAGGAVKGQKLDPARNLMEFSKLPWQAQTVIADLWYNMGDLRVAAPNFWKQVTTGDWEGAYQNLRNFSQADQTLAARARRNAKLLREAIDMSAIPDY